MIKFNVPINKETLNGINIKDYMEQVFDDDTTICENVIDDFIIKYNRIESDDIIQKALLIEIKTFLDYVTYTITNNKLECVFDDEKFLYDIKTKEI